MQFEPTEIEFLLAAIKDFSAFGHTRDDVVKKLRKHQETYLLLSPEDAGLFKPILDSFSEPDFDEAKYSEVITGLEPKNVVAFLRYVICTYEGTMKFLSECLHMTQQRQLEFDT